MTYNVIAKVRVKYKGILYLPGDPMVIDEKTWGGNGGGNFQLVEEIPKPTPKKKSKKKVEEE